MDIILSADKRDLGKSTKKLRKEGWIPGSVYGKSMESSPIMIKAATLQKCLKQGASKVHLKVGSDKFLASLEEVQKNAVGTEILHVSLHAFGANEKVTITVPVHLEGKAIGQTSGGVLGQQLNTVDLYGLPGDIPDSLTVDVSKLELGHSIHIGDLPKGKYEIKDGADKVIVACNYPKIQEIETETTAEATEVAAPEVDTTGIASSDAKTEKAA